MALVKGLSLAALQLLGTEITFQTWKGKPYARQRQRKTGTPRDIRTKQQNRMFQLATLCYRSIRQSVADAYVYWTATSYWTRRDKIYSQVMRVLHAEHQSPLMFSEFSAAWEGANLRITYSTLPARTTTDWGFGTIAYGRSPYGHPAAMATDAGYALAPIFALGYAPPIPHPKPDYELSPIRQVPCKVPPPIFPDEIHDGIPNDKWTADNTSWIFDEARERIQLDFDPVCTTAFDTAWAGFSPGTGTSPTAFRHPQIELISYITGPNTIARIMCRTETWRLILPDWMTSQWWTYVTKIELRLWWTYQQDLSPWKLTVTLAGKTKTLDAGDTYVTWTDIPAYAKELTLTTWHNDQKPAAPCPPPVIKSDYVGVNMKPTIYWSTDCPFGTYLDTNPPTPPFITFPTGIDGNLTPTTPPVLIDSGP